jgi:hypothetical protein
VSERVGVALGVCVALGDVVALGVGVRLGVRLELGVRVGVRPCDADADGVAGVVMHSWSTDVPAPPTPTSMQLNMSCWNGVPGGSSQSLRHWSSKQLYVAFSEQSNFWNMGADSLNVRQLLP